MVGPDMAKVYEILREQNDKDERRTPKFPILELHETSEKTLEVVVKTWTKDRDISFATISHVWSDGMGSSDENKIYYCQLKLIFRLLTDIAGLGHDNAHSPTRAVPFWIDTMLIPTRNARISTSRGKDSITPKDFDDLKRRAIPQTSNVFNAATHCIVIDRGLLQIDSKGTPLKNAMSILASGWMRRLWTLQEAFLSKQLWVVFKQGDSKHMGIENFDELLGLIASNDTFGSAMANMVRLKLFSQYDGA